MFPDDLEAFGKAKDFPYVATTYRLTEHFHYWTKHGINAVAAAGGVRGDRRGAGARRKASSRASWVRVSSKRGYRGVALVTKRIRR